MSREDLKSTFQILCLHPVIQQGWLVPNPANPPSPRNPTSPCARAHCISCTPRVHGNNTRRSVTGELEGGGGSDLKRDSMLRLVLGVV